MNILEEKSNLLSEQVAKSANNLEGKSRVAKLTCSVIKQVRVLPMGTCAEYLKFVGKRFPQNLRSTQTPWIDFRVANTIEGSQKILTLVLRHK